MPSTVCDETEILMFCLQLTRICSYTIHGSHGEFLGFKHEGFKRTVHNVAQRLNVSPQLKRTLKAGEEIRHWSIIITCSDFRKSKKSSHRSVDLSNSH